MKKTLCPLRETCMCSLKKSWEKHSRSAMKPGPMMLTDLLRFEFQPDTFSSVETGQPDNGWDKNDDLIIFLT